MKKITLFVAITMFAFTSFSQDKKSGSSTFTGGLELGLPMGNFGNSHNLGIGASVHGLFGDKSGFTASIGYMAFSGKTVGLFTSSSFNFIPVKLGYRMASEGGFYFEPQVGWSFISGSSGFTYAPVVGMTTGSFDISARYEGVSLTGSGGTLSFVGTRIAFKF